MKEKAERIGMRYFYPKAPAYAALDAHLLEAEQEAERPLWQRQPVADPTEPYLREYTGSWVKSIGNTYGRFMTHLQLIRLELALQEYRQRVGRFPDRLEQLAPTYLASILPDPFTGRPFRYRRTAAGYLLYSLGSNATDEGGEPHNPRTPDSGDLVAGRLLPPQRLAAPRQPAR